MSRVRAWDLLALAGAGAALLGILGAWVPHRAAALVLSGWDLAEFVKFLPGVAATRELFYLPVWCLGLALALTAHRPGATPLRRIGLTAPALALMVALLPPYPFVLNGFQSVEFRGQFLLGTSGLLLVLAAWPVARRWPVRVVGGLLLAVALVGALPALWQFLRVRGAIQAVYAAGLGWGWGLVAFLAGWFALSLFGGWLLLPGARRSA